MKVFFKAQLSSLLATGVDFLLMICLVEAFKLHYTLAVLIGATAGAFTNFMLNRYWSFNVSDKPVRAQGFKYLLVWTGSVLLNVSGVYMLTGLFKVQYIVSKIIVAVSVGLGFNYILQKRYVFNPK